MLYVLGVFLALLAVIPGKSAWAWMRENLLFDVFGVSGWLLGLMVIYFATVVSLKKPAAGHVARGLFFLFALSGMALSFSKLDFAGMTFGEVVLAALNNGSTGWFTGGFIGLLFGGLLLALVGTVAARVLLVLLAVFAALLLFRVKPADIARFAKGVAARVPRRAAREDDGYYEDDTPAPPSPNEKPLPPAQQVRAEIAAKEARGIFRGNGFAGRGQKAQAPVAKPLPHIAGRPRRSVVDIPLGPQEAAGGTAAKTAAGAAAGVSGVVTVATAGKEPFEIGPGGTFGMRPLMEAVGLDENDPMNIFVKKKEPPKKPEPVDYFEKPLRPFDAHSDESILDEGAKENILLFGEDDPYSLLGGPDSALDVRNLPDLEYIAGGEPAPAPGFDLFGTPGTGSVFGTAGMPDEPAPAPAAQPANTSPFATGTLSFGKAAVAAAPQEDDLPWHDGEQDTGGAATDGGVHYTDMPAPAAATGGEVEPGVEALIDKAAAVKPGTLPATDTREKDAENIEPYKYPPLTLFDTPKVQSDAGAKEEMTKTAELLVGTLSSFGVQTKILDVSRGPSVTRYEVQPNAGVKISKITALSDDIALNLSAAGVRIEAPIPGKPAVGIEVPNKIKSPVGIRSVLESSAFAAQMSPLAVALGKDIAGECVVADLTRMPHLLIAGSTGSGKSVCVNSIIMSILYRSAPEDVQLMLIDPKVVELAEYNGIPHLLIPVVTEPRQAAKALGYAVAMMEQRYHTFAENNVRDIKSFNALTHTNGVIEKMPHIAIIIDELADLMMTAGKDVETYICRLAQKARAAGMHMIVATQRPSVDVITGLIKANIPSRIAFAVSSQVDSRTILDSVGAEKLLGMGDMLFMPLGANKPVRVQGTFVQDKEITRVLNFVKQGAPAHYNDDILAEMEKITLSGQQPKDEAAGGDDDNSWRTDPVFLEAVEIALEAGTISTSYLQRRLRLGYARAGRVMDEMERLNIVGPPNGSKPREVMITRDEWLEMMMNHEG